jgi:DNA-binding transcriptional MerR regulator
MRNSVMMSAVIESAGFDAAGIQGRSYAKSKLAFRTIGEAAVELDVEQHILRFWESKFSQIRPLKRGGGRRYYRPEDVDQLRRIRSLLYDDGYTIKGVQRLLKEGRGRRAASEAVADEAPAPVVAQPRPAARLDGDKRRQMEAILGDLQDALGQLRVALYPPH